MPDEPAPGSLEIPALGDIAESIVAKLLEPQIVQKIQTLTTNVLVEVLKPIVGILMSAAGTIGVAVAEGIAEGEDVANPVYGRIAAAAVKDLFGVNVSPAELVHRPGAGGATQAARSLGAIALKGLTGGVGSPMQGEMKPTVTPTENYLSFVLQMGLEGWIQGLLVEFASLGAIEKFADLDDTMAQVLGLSRLTRHIVGPVVDATVVMPAEWLMNQTYRPKLLSAADAIRQFLRGRKDRSWLEDELSKQGWSSDRIDALVNGQQKVFSAGDVRTFVTRGHWDEQRGLQHLKDQGYDQATAEDALRLEGLRRIEQLENTLASAIISAYADRRITDSEFRRLLSEAVLVPSERALLQLVGEMRREVNVRALSPSQAEACVKAGVEPMNAYRDALRRDGYTEDAILSLELLLRYEIDKQTDLEAARAAAEAERAAEKAARAAEKAARLAALEEERRERRRGPIGDLSRAVVRGLIPLARAVEVLRFDYDDDTVDILAGLIEDDRLRFLEQQQRAEDARQRALRRDLDVGRLESAVLENVISLADFRTRLEQLRFDPADVDVLAETLAARKEALDDARRRRDEAAALAAKRQIDLGRFELLVRRGVRSRRQYESLLQDLGLDVAARAVVLDLLDLRIADDRAADEARRQAEAALRNRGLSLEQFRRGVVLGVRSVDDYQRFLVEQGFTASAQEVLLADVRDAVAEAEAARRRRAEADRARREPALPLAEVSRAARLGVIHPDIYRARLTHDGYSSDDIAIEMELLLLEIADVQAARRRRAEQEARAAARGLSLETVERAVKLGIVPVDAYRARAAELQVAADDVELLVAILEDEMATAVAAAARREQLEADSARRDPSIAQLEQAVKAQLMTVDEFEARVRSYGYAPEDAALLTALLVDELTTAAEQAQEGGGP